MRPLKYKILQHTADLRLEVFGKTQEGLFMNASEALNEILAPASGRNPAEELKEEIRVQGPNLNVLLVDFLNEILSRSHVNKQVCKVKNLKLKGNSVEAELAIYPIKKFKEDIKAVTYHEVDIKKEGNIFKTNLVFDI